ncbi:MAG: hypothetical protein ABI361_02080 [Nitrososphaera sp.]|jgi:hypothetical protein
MINRTATTQSRFFKLPRFVNRDEIAQSQLGGYCYPLEYWPYVKAITEFADRNEIDLERYQDDLLYDELDRLSFFKDDRYTWMTDGANSGNTSGILAYVYRDHVERREREKAAADALKEIA